MRIAPCHGGAQVHDVGVEPVRALRGGVERSAKIRQLGAARGQLALQRGDAVAAGEQVIFERRQVGALHVEATARGIQRLELPV